MGALRAFARSALLRAYEFGNRIKLMESIMLQFKHPGSVPTVAEVCRLFALFPHEVDADFGVIGTDPEADLYTVLVDVTATERVQAALQQRVSDPAEGLFGNPQIAPMQPD